VIRLGVFFARVARATTPDPFVLAIVLTLVTFALAYFVEGVGPVAIIESWQGDSGFFGLLAFTMQMVLILVTGHALARAPLIARGLEALANVPRSGAQAAALVAIVAMATALLNWGLGLITGAILAREVGRSGYRRGIPVHYPIVAAAGYSGLLVWHGGLSGTAPLMMTTADNVQRFLGADLGRQVEPLTFGTTVFGPLNLLVTGGLLVIVPTLYALLVPKKIPDEASFERFEGEAPREEPAGGARVIDRLESSPLLMLAIAVPLVVAVWTVLKDTGLGRLDPNALNLIFLTAGLLLHGNVRNYLTAVEEGVRGTAGIVIQFPFYAGIMGVMRGTGLAATLAALMTSAQSTSAFYGLTLTSAALVNLFVPSGGGQWAVQGPIVVTAGEALGADLATAVMAVAYGDQLTNMLQPFWALPLLAITRVQAKDIIGYTGLVMSIAAVWMLRCLTLW